MRITATLGLSLALGPMLFASSAVAQRNGANVLYFETNDASSNSVVGYSRAHDGSLSLLGVFSTGGLGYKNVDQRLGPDDTDREVVESPDGTWLFAVNMGSNDISVFRILEDGRLRLVNNRPFPSGGIQPASLTFVAGDGGAPDRLYVVNRGDGILLTATEPSHTGTPGATNYTGFDIDGNGRLCPIANSTVVLQDGSSPSQIIHSLNGNNLFADNLFVPDSSVTPPAPLFPASRSFLDGFHIDRKNGALKRETSTFLPPSLAATNTTVALPLSNAPFVLGLETHPSENILYGGLVAFGDLGVWSYSGDDLVFEGIESDPNNLGPLGGICWLAADSAGKYLYTSSIAVDKIGVFSLANPKKPVRIQDFALGGDKGPLVGPGMPPTKVPEPFGFTTAPFNLAVAPDGRFLYVLTNQTCTSDLMGSTGPDPACVDGTAIHTMKIASNGMLTEVAGSPLVIPPSVVPYHAKGIVVR